MQRSFQKIASRGCRAAAHIPIRPASVTPVACINAACYRYCCHQQCATPRRPLAAPVEAPVRKRERQWRTARDCGARNREDHSRQCPRTRTKGLSKCTSVQPMSTPYSTPFWNVMLKKNEMFDFFHFLSSAFFINCRTFEGRVSRGKPAAWRNSSKTSAFLAVSIVFEHETTRHESRPRRNASQTRGSSGKN